MAICVITGLATTWHNSCNLAGTDCVQPDASMILTTCAAFPCNELGVEGDPYELVPRLLLVWVSVLPG